LCVVFGIFLWRYIFCPVFGYLVLSADLRKSQDKCLILFLCLQVFKRIDVFFFILQWRAVSCNLILKCYELMDLHVFDCNLYLYWISNCLNFGQ
jgi:hypothetical protein